MGVQEKLEEALDCVAGSSGEIRLKASGRTDAGVHALQQVAHFDSKAQRRPEQWVGGVNTQLPESVRLLWAARIADHRAMSFHARHWTRTRSYLYLLDNGSVQDPLWRDRSGYCPTPLNVEAMRCAIQELRGLHDFSAFRSSNCKARSPLRHMHHTEIFRLDGMLAFHFVANSFLQNMVRILVGTLVEIGKGQHPDAWMRELLRSGDRKLAGRTVVSRGLHFLGPAYPSHCGLPPSPPPQACWSRTTLGDVRTGRENDEESVQRLGS